MGTGTNRMNSLTVLQTTQGLCEYLTSDKTKSISKDETLSVVIGFDGRRNSQKFANVAASVFISKQFKVFLFSVPTPTPLTPFIVAKYNCVAGIQITASHNPKDDNGYKLFGSSGAQIIPPMDSDIEDSILKNLSPWKSALECLDLNDEQLKLINLNQVCDPMAIVTTNSDIIESAEEIYLEMMTKELSSKSQESSSSASSSSNETNNECLPPARFVYTAMHGVGWDLISKLWSRFGLTSETLLPVASQQFPDHNFPTVVFPNPEEKGALDLSIKYATDINADYVIANDPDADRFTAAEKQADGTWKLFSGDQLGILFADWQFMCFTKTDNQIKGKRKHNQTCAAAENEDENGENQDSRVGLFITSVVSSRMLSKFAQARHCQYRDTLTGFKYMANESISVRNGHPNYVHLLAYEEAIGYQLSGSVPDKDGVSAACVWAEMANYYRKKGLRIADQLLSLQKELGHFVTNNGYFICKDPSITEAMFNEFRHNKYMLGNDDDDNGKCLDVRDVTLGIGSDLPPTPNAQMIQFRILDVIVTLRASGTEPKIKYYTEYAAIGPDAAMAEMNARKILGKVEQLIIKWFYQPEKFGVVKG